jgi:type I restriction enzyme R subunit
MDAALSNVTRAERANTRKAAVLLPFNEKLREFLEFVLGQYVDRGVEELDQEKLSGLLNLRYGGIADATTHLGSKPREIRQAFIRFQKGLF